VGFVAGLQFSMPCDTNRASMCLGQDVSIYFGVRTILIPACCVTGNCTVLYHSCLSLLRCSARNVIQFEDTTSMLARRRTYFDPSRFSIYYAEGSVLRTFQPRQTCHFNAFPSGSKLQVRLAVPCRGEVPCQGQCTCRRSAALGPCMP
jgi:hypothetical protein